MIFNILGLKILLKNDKDDRELLELHSKGVIETFDNLKKNYIILLIVMKLILYKHNICKMSNTVSTKSNFTLFKILFLMFPLFVKYGFYIQTTNNLYAYP